MIHQRHRQTGGQDIQDNGSIAYDEPFYKPSPKDEYMDYGIAATMMTLGDFQGHSLIPCLFKWREKRMKSEKGFELEAMDGTRW